jgi:hypothetical protein
MKSITIALAVLVLLFASPAYADTFDFTWHSQAWTLTYESPTRAVVSGPFTLSGRGSATFAEIAGDGAELRFDGAFGGTLVASGDGTYNGPMTFPTRNHESRNGLGVLTPNAEGFTISVHRAASGPDAGATFFGTGSRSDGTATVAATEPITAALTLAGLVVAGLASRQRRV